MKNQILKTISLLVAIIFSTNTIASSAPAVYAIRVPEAYGKVVRRWNAPMAQDHRQKTIDKRPETTDEINITDAQSTSESKSMVNGLVSSVLPKTVILIEDAHQNFTAQKNITDIILSLMHEHNVKSEECVVGFEGASGDLGLDAFRQYPFHDVRRQIAESLVEKGLLTGGEESVISAPKMFDAVGVEDSTLFQEDYAAYRSLIEQKDGIRHFLTQLIEAIEKKKNDNFSETLMHSDFLYRQYRNNEVPVDVYVSDLLTAVQANTAIDISAYQMISILTELAMLENTKNKDNAQRRQTLVSLLDYEALQEELRGMYYQYALAIADGESSEQLILLQQEVDMVYDVLFVRAKRTCADRFLQKVVAGDYAAVLTAMLDRCSIHVSRESFDKWIAAAASFYALANKRDDVLLCNLLNTVTEKNKTVGILLVGGYHVRAMESLLTQRGISHLVVRPHVNGIHDIAGFLEKMKGTSPGDIFSNNYITALFSVLYDEVGQETVRRLFDKSYQEKIGSDPQKAAELFLMEGTRALSPELKEKAPRLYAYATEVAGQTIPIDDESYDDLVIRMKKDMKDDVGFQELARDIIEPTVLSSSRVHREKEPVSWVPFLLLVLERVDDLPLKGAALVSLGEVTQIPARYHGRLIRSLETALATDQETLHAAAVQALRRLRESGCISSDLAAPIFIDVLNALHNYTWEAQIEALLGLFASLEYDAEKYAELEGLLAYRLKNGSRHLTVPIASLLYQLSQRNIVAVNENVLTGYHYCSDVKELKSHLKREDEYFVFPRQKSEFRTEDLTRLTDICLNDMSQASSYSASVEKRRTVFNALLGGERNAFTQLPTLTLASQTQAFDDVVVDLQAIKDLSEIVDAEADTLKDAGRTVIVTKENGEKYFLKLQLAGETDEAFQQEARLMKKVAVDQQKYREVSLISMPLDEVQKMPISNDLTLLMRDDQTVHAILYVPTKAGYDRYGEEAVSLLEADVREKYIVDFMRTAIDETMYLFSHYGIAYIDFLAFMHSRSTDRAFSLTHLPFGNINRFSDACRESNFRESALADLSPEHWHHFTDEIDLISAQMLIDYQLFQFFLKAANLVYSAELSRDQLRKIMYEVATHYSTSFSDLFNREIAFNADAKMLEPVIDELCYALEMCYDKGVYPIDTMPETKIDQDGRSYCQFPNGPWYRGDFGMRGVHINHNGYFPAPSLLDYMQSVRNVIVTHLFNVNGGIVDRNTEGKSGTDAIETKKSLSFLTFDLSACSAEEKAEIRLLRNRYFRESFKQMESDDRYNPTIIAIMKAMFRVPPNTPAKKFRRFLYSVIGQDGKQTTLLTEDEIAYILGDFRIYDLSAEHSVFSIEEVYRKVSDAYEELLVAEFSEDGAARFLTLGYSLSALKKLARVKKIPVREIEERFKGRSMEDNLHVFFNKHIVDEEPLFGPEQVSIYHLEKKGEQDRRVTRCVISYAHHSFRLSLVHTTYRNDIEAGHIFFTAYYNKLVISNRRTNQEWVFPINDDGYVCDSQGKVLPENVRIMELGRKGKGSVCTLSNYMTGWETPEEKSLSTVIDAGLATLRSDIENTKVKTFRARLKTCRNALREFPEYAEKKNEEINRFIAERLNIPAVDYYIKHSFPASSDKTVVAVLGRFLSSNIVALRDAVLNELSSAVAQGDLLSFLNTRNNFVFLYGPTIYDDLFGDSLQEMLASHNLADLLPALREYTEIEKKYRDLLRKYELTEDDIARYCFSTESIEGKESIKDKIKADSDTAELILSAIWHKKVFGERHEFKNQKVTVRLVMFRINKEFCVDDFVLYEFLDHFELRYKDKKCIFPITAGGDVCAPGEWDSLGEILCSADLRKNKKTLQKTSGVIPVNLTATAKYLVYTDIRDAMGLDANVAVASVERLVRVLTGLAESKQPDSIKQQIIRTLFPEYPVQVETLATLAEPAYLTGHSQFAKNEALWAYMVSRTDYFLQTYEIAWTKEPFLSAARDASTSFDDMKESHVLTLIAHGIVPGDILGYDHAATKKKTRTSFNKLFTAKRTVWLDSLIRYRYGREEQRIFSQQIKDYRWETSLRGIRFGIPGSVYAEIERTCNAARVVLETDVANLYVIAEGPVQKGGEVDRTKLLSMPLDYSENEMCRLHVHDELVPFSSKVSGSGWYSLGDDIRRALDDGLMHSEQATDVAETVILFRSRENEKEPAHTPSLTQYVDAKNEGVFLQSGIDKKSLAVYMMRFAPYLKRKVVRDSRECLKAIFDITSLKKGERHPFVSVAGESYCVLHNDVIHVPYALFSDVIDEKRLFLVDYLTHIDLTFDAKPIIRLAIDSNGQLSYEKGVIGSLNTLQGKAVDLNTIHIPKTIAETVKAKVEIEEAKRKELEVERKKLKEQKKKVTAEMIEVKAQRRKVQAERRRLESKINELKKEIAALEFGAPLAPRAGRETKNGEEKQNADTDADTNTGTEDKQSAEIEKTLEEEIDALETAEEELKAEKQELAVEEQRLEGERRSFEAEVIKLKEKKAAIEEEHARNTKNAETEVVSGIGVVEDSLIRHWEERVRQIASLYREVENVEKRVHEKAALAASLPLRISNAQDAIVAMTEEAEDHRKNAEEEENLVAELYRQKEERKAALAILVEKRKEEEKRYRSHEAQLQKILTQRKQQEARLAVLKKQMAGFSQNLSKGETLETLKRVHTDTKKELSVARKEEKNEEKRLAEKEETLKKARNMLVLQQTMAKRVSTDFFLEKVKEEEVRVAELEKECELSGSALVHKKHRIEELQKQLENIEDALKVQIALSPLQKKYDKEIQRLRVLEKRITEHQESGLLIQKALGGLDTEIATVKRIDITSDERIQSHEERYRHALSTRQSLEENITKSIAEIQALIALQEKNDQEHRRMIDFLQTTLGEAERSVVNVAEDLASLYESLLKKQFVRDDLVWIDALQHSLSEYSGELKKIRERFPQSTAQKETEIREKVVSLWSQYEQRRNEILSDADFTHPLLLWLKQKSGMRQVFLHHERYAKDVLHTARKKNQSIYGQIGKLKKKSLPQNSVVIAQKLQSNRDLRNAMHALQKMIDENVSGVEYDIYMHILRLQVVVLKLEAELAWIKKSEADENIQQIEKQEKYLAVQVEELYQALLEARHSLGETDTKTRKLRQMYIDADDALVRITSLKDKKIQKAEQSFNSAIDEEEMVGDALEFSEALLGIENELALLDTVKRALEKETRDEREVLADVKEVLEKKRINETMKDAHGDDTDDFVPKKHFSKMQLVVFFIGLRILLELIDASGVIASVIKTGIVSFPESGAAAFSATSPWSEYVFAFFATFASMGALAFAADGVLRSWNREHEQKRQFTNLISAALKKKKSHYNTDIEKIMRSVFHQPRTPHAERKLLLAKQKYDVFLTSELLNEAQVAFLLPNHNFDSLEEIYAAVEVFDVVRWYEHLEAEYQKLMKALGDKSLVVGCLKIGFTLDVIEKLAQIKGLSIVTIAEKAGHKNQKAPLVEAVSVHIKKGFSENEPIAKGVLTIYSVPRGKRTANVCIFTYLNTDYHFRFDKTKYAQDIKDRKVHWKVWSEKIVIHNVRSHEQWEFPIDGERYLCDLSGKRLPEQIQVRGNTEKNRCILSAYISGWHMTETEAIEKRIHELTDNVYGKNAKSVLLKIRRVEQSLAELPSFETSSDWQRLAWIVRYLGIVSLTYLFEHADESLEVAQAKSCITLFVSDRRLKFEQDILMQTKKCCQNLDMTGLTDEMLLSYLKDAIAELSIYGPRLYDDLFSTVLRNGEKETLSLRAKIQYLLLLSEDEVIGQWAEEVPLSKTELKIKEKAEKDEVSELQVHKEEVHVPGTEQKGTARDVHDREAVISVKKSGSATVIDAQDEAILTNLRTLIDAFVEGNNASNIDFLRRFLALCVEHTKYIGQLANSSTNQNQGEETEDQQRIRRLKDRLISAYRAHYQKMRGKRKNTEKVMHNETDNYVVQWRSLFLVVVRASEYRPFIQEVWQEYLSGDLNWIFARLRNVISDAERMMNDKACRHGLLFNGMPLDEKHSIEAGAGSSILGLSDVSIISDQPEGGKQKDADIGSAHDMEADVCLEGAMPDEEENENDDDAESEAGVIDDVDLEDGVGVPFDNSLAFLGDDPFIGRADYVRPDVYYGDDKDEDEVHSSDEGASLWDDPSKEGDLGDEDNDLLEALYQRREAILKKVQGMRLLLRVRGGELGIVGALRKSEAELDEITHHIEKKEKREKREKKRVSRTNEKVLTPKVNMPPTHAETTFSKVDMPIAEQRLLTEKNIVPGSVTQEMVEDNVDGDDDDDKPLKTVEELLQELAEIGVDVMNKRGITIFAFFFLRVMLYLFDPTNSVAGLLKAVESGAAALEAGSFALFSAWVLKEGCISAFIAAGIFVAMSVISFFGEYSEDVPSEPIPKSNDDIERAIKEELEPLLNNVWAPMHMPGVTMRTKCTKNEAVIYKDAVKKENIVARVNYTFGERQKGELRISTQYVFSQKNRLNKGNKLMSLLQLWLFSYLKPQIVTYFALQNEGIGFVRSLIANGYLWCNKDRRGTLFFQPIEKQIDMLFRNDQHIDHFLHRRTHQVLPSQYALSQDGIRMTYDRQQSLGLVAIVVFLNGNGNEGGIINLDKCTIENYATFINEFFTKYKKQFYGRRVQIVPVYDGVFHPNNWQELKEVLQQELNEYDVSYSIVVQEKEKRYAYDIRLTPRLGKIFVNGVEYDLMGADQKAKKLTFEPLTQSKPQFFDILHNAELPAGPVAVSDNFSLDEVSHVFRHSERVKQTVLTIAKHIGIAVDYESLDCVLKLHDIGKFANDEMLRLTNTTAHFGQDAEGKRNKYIVDSHPAYSLAMIDQGLHKTLGMYPRDPNSLERIMIKWHKAPHLFAHDPYFHEHSEEKEEALRLFYLFSVVDWCDTYFIARRPHRWALSDDEKNIAAVRKMIKKKLDGLLAVSLFTIDKDIVDAFYAYLESDTFQEMFDAEASYHGENYYDMYQSWQRLEATDAMLQALPYIDRMDVIEAITREGVYAESSRMLREAFPDNDMLQNIDEVLLREYLKELYLFYSKKLASIEGEAATLAERMVSVFYATIENLNKQISVEGHVREIWRVGALFSAMGKADIDYYPACAQVLAHIKMYEEREKWQCASDNDVDAIYDAVGNAFFSNHAKNSFSMASALVDVGLFNRGRAKSSPANFLVCVENRLFKNQYYVLAIKQLMAHMEKVYGVSIHVVDEEEAVSSSSPPDMWLILDTVEGRSLAVQSCMRTDESIFMLSSDVSIFMRDLSYLRRVLPAYLMHGKEGFGAACELLMSSQLRQTVAKYVETGIEELERDVAVKRAA